MALYLSPLSPQLSIQIKFFDWGFPFHFVNQPVIEIKNKKRFGVMLLVTDMTDVKELK